MLVAELCVEFEWLDVVALAARALGCRGAHTVGRLVLDLERRAVALGDAVHAGGQRPDLAAASAAAVHGCTDDAARYPAYAAETQAVAAVLRDLVLEAPPNMVGGSAWRLPAELLKLAQKVS